MADQVPKSVVSKTTVTTTSTGATPPSAVFHDKNVPVIHNRTSCSPEELLDRLVSFNSHVDHIARVEGILMHDMGLAKEDADVFIRAGVDAVFGRVPTGMATAAKANVSAGGPGGELRTPDSTVGIWMNELRQDWDETTFFLEATKPVLVNFEEHVLRVRSPNRRVIPRLAMYNETEKRKKDFAWNDERTYDLRNADVFLLPLDVPVKIRWLSRFPIAIKLKMLGEAKGELLVEPKTGASPKFLKKDDATLILFARCDREKEELFWRLISASGKTPYRFAMPPIDVNPSMTPLTAFIHRAAADILVDPLWKTILFEKFAQKLAQIKRPHYLEELKLTDFNMGNSLPTFGVVSDDIRIDRLGTWFEVDFELRGPIILNLQTSLNVFKMTHPEDSKGKENAESDEEKTKLVYNTLSALYGGYEEDDNDFEEESEMPEKSKPKAMRIMEYIAESKAFKYFSEIGFIRRSLEDISNTDMNIAVEVNLIKGRIAANLPHPPSDRLWYGFIPAPQVEIAVTPKLNEKAVDFTMVTDFMQSGAKKAFHQIFTIPNMDDITIPFANSGIDPDDYRLGKLRDLVVKLA